MSQTLMSFDSLMLLKIFSGVNVSAMFAGLSTIRPLDETIEVRDHDVVTVPHGYHGPCTAAPGYPMYYLNVMAGPADRALAFCDDPDHGWIRDSWASQQLDPRCPVTSAAGRTDGKASS